MAKWVASTSMFLLFSMVHKRFIFFISFFKTRLNHLLVLDILLFIFLKIRFEENLSETQLKMICCLTPPISATARSNIEQILL